MIFARGVVARADATRIELAVPDWPGHRAGQFAMLGLDPARRHRDPLLPRPMAVYRRSGELLEFRFKPVGRGTRLLAEQQRGAELSVLGPLGNGFPAPSPGDWLVGGGTGIASLYELARDAPRGVRVRLGGRSRADILGLADFEALGVDLAVATDDGSHGARGFVTELVAPGPGETVYACGPTPMMRRAHELAARAGARCMVSLENNMACGYGVCLGCAVRTPAGFRYVCTHGPVFDSAALGWSAA
ncbi:MAG TPA: dihydroorotate dehydrogenase electron transfer subunit [Myxococcota bacterium]|nr:dihydroorotate dehydrogenase electron transfer subunit [Myxococcota bacterium]